VYGPKLFAAIGHLPDTLVDRSIVIRMKRRTQAQHVERFRQARAAVEGKGLHDGAARFMQAHDSDVEQAYQRVLDNDLGYLNDRDADLWTPLFAVCSILDPERLPELKKCALTLSAAKAGDDIDDSYPLTLLRDIRAVWPDGEEKIETAVLLERLKALEESPWSEHELTARKLARMLKPFEIEPRNIRVGDSEISRVAKGYIWGEVKTASEPYLADLSATCATEQ
jgi:hypothetical protein